MRKRKSLAEYEKGILEGDRVILSQAITLVESNLETDQLLASHLVQQVMSHTGNSIRIGITGVPGVGKSTFIEAFGEMLLAEGKKVAVLAIDPTSQKTKGSILGDKTRMEKLSGDSRAFIRPSPSGVTLGGVSSKTREAMLLCEAAGFDVILIETVGVGQSETAVKGMVDFFLLLMLAGAGDELQGIKKGIMEMADALFINKAEEENMMAAKRAKQHYQNALHLFPLGENGWSPQVLLGSAMQKKGLKACWDLIDDYCQLQKRNGHLDKNRAGQRVKWLEESVLDLLGRAFFSQKEIRSEFEIGKEKVKSGIAHPLVLAYDLLEKFLKK